MKSIDYLNSKKVLATFTGVFAVITFMQFFVINDLIGEEYNAEKPPEKDSTLMEKKADANKGSAEKATQSQEMREPSWVGKKYSLIDPYQEMWLMQKEMDKLFNQAFNRFRHSPGFPLIQQKGMMFSPQYDLKDDGKKYIVKLDLPGVKKAEIKITLQNRLLTIAGIRKEEVQQKSDKMVKMERRLGKFARTFSLPGPVDKKKIKAVYKDGVLTVTLPKTIEEKEKIEIKVEE